MDMHTHRRQRLLFLIDRDFGGDRMAMGHQLGLTKVRMGQLLSDTFREGQNFGEKIARKIEGSLGLPLLYLDQGADADEAAPALPARANLVTVSSAAPGSMALDEGELSMVHTYRQAGPITKAAIRKILRVMLVADEAAISEQAHTFCRAVNEQMQMSLVITPQINDAAFDELELMLLGNFRACSARVKRLVLAGADCVEPRDDDAEIDRDTGCTLQELRLINQYRNGSTPFRHTLLRLVSVEPPKIDAKQQHG